MSGRGLQRVRNCTQHGGSSKIQCSNTVYTHQKLLEESPSEKKNASVEEMEIERGLGVVRIQSANFEKNSMLAESVR